MEEGGGSGGVAKHFLFDDFFSVWIKWRHGVS